MAQQIVNVRAASTLGMIFCAVFTGANLLMSTAVMPTLLLPGMVEHYEPKEGQPSGRVCLAAKSQHLARQWQNLYNIGSRAGPVVALGGVSSFVFAARSTPQGLTLSYRLSLTAAGLCVAILPFTLVFMKRLNDELHRRADAGFKSSKQQTSTGEGAFQNYETPDLIRRWSTLNLMRASLHIAAIACGFTTLLL